MSLYKANLKYVSFLLNVKTFRKNDIPMSLTVRVKERKKRNEKAYKALPLDQYGTYLVISPYVAEDWNSYKSTYVTLWDNNYHKAFALKRFV